MRFGLGAEVFYVGSQGCEQDRWLRRGGCGQKDWYLTGRFSISPDSSLTVEGITLACSDSYCRIPLRVGWTNTGGL